ncbi:MAG: hypothetical protein N2115_00025 [bacterium]|nr:hypothetical protein [bacterium]
MLIQNIDTFRKKDSFSCVIGIGKFDGFHIAHQRIIKNILRISSEIKSTPAVFTIRNYPSVYVLTEWDQKIKMFKNSGIKLCLWADFNNISRMSHMEFLERLYSVSNFKVICVGANFRFGHNRLGNIAFVRQWARKKGISVHVVKPVIFDGEVVSSTRIKKLILESEFIKAKKMLGRWYVIEGVCIQGHGMGRKIGFPTINLELKNKNIPLAHGIYACIAKEKDKLYKAVLFYGRSSTFGLPVSFEIHILDSKLNNASGRTFSVIPVKRIRNVRKFKSVCGLAKRIKMDIIEASELLGSLNLTKFLKNCSI